MGKLITTNEDLHKKSVSISILRKSKDMKSSKKTSIIKRYQMKDKNTLTKYRVLMQDIESKFHFAIFVETKGLFSAEHSALTEFHFADVVEIRKVF